MGTSAEQVQNILRLLENGKGEQNAICTLLVGIAEEASELAQAALKLWRFYDGTNPCTPDKTENVLLYNLTEEFVDTSLIMEMVSDKIFNMSELGEIIDNILDRKVDRWETKLKNRNEKR